MYIYSNITVRIYTLAIYYSLIRLSIVIEKSVAISLIGAVTSPLSLFVVAFATLSLPEGMQKAAPLVPALKSNWLMMHVSIMMLSYSTLITGSLLSILFLVLTLGKNVSLQGNSMGSTQSQESNTARSTAARPMRSPGRPQTTPENVQGSSINPQ